jgi:hypothetical protein
MILDRILYAIVHPPKLSIDKIREKIVRDANEIKEDVLALSMRTIQELKQHHEGILISWQK